MANEICLFGPIGYMDDGSGVTSQQVKTFLASADQSQPLVVRIDSEGGSVFDGLSIYDAFKNYPGPKRAIIESTAFSIASYIAMAFDEIVIAENGYVMIHEPASEVEGTAGELERKASTLKKLDQSMVEAYSQRTGLSEEEVRALMKDETYMNASEALNYGFVTTVASGAVASRIQPQARHKSKLPQRVYASLFGEGSRGDNSETTKEQPMSNTQQPVAATVQEIKAAYPRAKADFIVRCLERSLPMASVAKAASDEMLSENEQLVAQNEELMAKCRAMEEELTALKAKAMEEETTTAEGEEYEPEAEYDEEEEVTMRAKAKAKAAARGAKPVARVRGKSTKLASATAEWNAAIKDTLGTVGGDRMRAVAMVNRRFPGLRERMLAEHN